MKSTIPILLLLATAVFAEDTVLELDPARTQVEFTLSDVLHAIHGTFKLKRGTIRYDFATGSAAGEMVIDAQSGDSGSEARDKRMHKNILESGRYPDIVFIPDHVEGELSKASVHGAFRIHGKDHEMTLLVEAVPKDSEMDIKTHLVVPYVQWGMKNPSTLLLRVGNKVNIDIHAQARIHETDTTPARSR